VCAAICAASIDRSLASGSLSAWREAVLHADCSIRCSGWPRTPSLLRFRVGRDGCWGYGRLSFLFQFLSPARRAPALLEKAANWERVPILHQGMLLRSPSDKMTRPNELCCVFNISEYRTSLAPAGLSSSAGAGGTRCGFRELSKPIAPPFRHSGYNCSPRIFVIRPPVCAPVILIAPSRRSACFLSHRDGFRSSPIVFDFAHRAYVITPGRLRKSRDKTPFGTFLRPGMTGVDIGANVGFQTMQMAHVVAATAR